MQTFLETYIEVDKAAQGEIGLLELQYAYEKLGRVKVGTAACIAGVEFSSRSHTRQTRYELKEFCLKYARDGLRHGTYHISYPAFVTVRQARGEGGTVARRCGDARSDH